ncbi:restriction endonuclease subunit S [Fervidobacterium sp. 2310opik-2]|uniref:restriction endonuclease subunit S n=1 Tax=Fervidobacterium sp. 2310opik-2 TaxID=1755815 RepID=UPI0013E08650|nr:restriction endonuclease subunit S [Fervidobacterium sp. 2310opik-2]KAF2961353.1 restriction endonuclease subunit S [Fervidobacterium sp. 2310opik-2]
MSENVKVLEGWKRVKLGEVLSISRIPDNEKDPNKRITVRLWNKGVFAREVREVELNREKESTIYYKRKAGQFIYGKQNLVRGAFGVIPPELDGYCSTSDVPSFDVSKNLDVYYLDYTLRTLYKAFSLYEKGTGSKRVHEKDFLSFEIFLPPIFEQQKIAEILKTVDRAIEKTGKIIEKYKRIKQGLMQDLLTKGIDENGKIRNEKTHKFKDSPIGRIPEKWEVVRLMEVVSSYAGGTPNRDIDEFYNGNIKWLKSGEISKKYISDTEEKITEKGLKFSNAKYIAVNAVVIALYGATAGQVGIVKDILTANQAVLALNILDKLRLFHEYLYYFLSKFIPMILSQLQGSGQPNLSKNIVDNTFISLPPLPEQQRIASVLSQIDEVIEKEEAYKEKLERIKKGLMEDLLTGKVRVDDLTENQKEEF